MPDPGYEYFEHTADIGMRVRGRSVDELFVNAARGMIGLLVEELPTGTSETHPMQLIEESLEDLLYRYLRELLFWFSAEKFLASACHLRVAEEAGHWTLRGWIDGERFDPSRHAPGTEIKGVTHHQFRIGRVEAGWEAEVIFDV
jgi:SHS2 domain-containing protein